MADEITYNANLTLVNGYLKATQNPGPLRATQATPGEQAGIQIIGFAADEVIAYGDLVAPRWSWFRNVSTANNITLGPTSGGVIIPLITLLPGEACCFPIATSAVLRGQSTVTNNKLDRLILET